MSEASLDARDIAVSDESLSTDSSGDAHRQRDGLSYHKQGHKFYKERYYRTKTKLSRARLIAVALAILVSLVGVRVATVTEENSTLENRISELELMLYERADRR